MTSEQHGQRKKRWLVEKRKGGKEDGVKGKKTGTTVTPACSKFVLTGRERRASLARILLREQYAHGNVRSALIHCAPRERG